MAKNKQIKMNLLDKIAGWLLLIGGFNWLPVGMNLIFGGSGTDLVTSIFGSGIISGLIFSLVGLSSLYFVYRVFVDFQ